MDFLSYFFNGFFNFVNTLPSWQAIILVILIFWIFLFSPYIKTFIIWLFKKVKSKKRSCGDCILIIFGISEKYKSQEDIINKRILSEQMNYVEQKIEQITLELLRTYKEQQIKISSLGNYYPEWIERDYINYREALFNSIELAKKECRRAFKENGFHTMSGKEFADYVKEKTIDLLSISRKYMMGAYYKDAAISIESRFKAFNEREFEDVVFDIFIKAKEIKINAQNKIKELEKNLKEDIDDFIKERK